MKIQTKKLEDSSMEKVSFKFWRISRIYNTEEKHKNNLPNKKKKKKRTQARDKQFSPKCNVNDQ